jgi:hypothetical protein
MGIRPAAVLALLPVLAAALGAADQRIVLDRPERVGDQATISTSCRSRQHRSITFDQQPAHVEDIDYTVALSGEREVLAVSAQAQATRLRVTVASLTRTPSGRPALTMLKAGAQLVAEWTAGHAAFRDGDGKELPEQVQQALRLVLDLGDGTPLQDRALGSAQPHAPGDQWAIDAVAAARLLASQRILVDPSGLTGSAAFSALVPGTGTGTSPEQEQLRITATLAFHGFTVPALPAGLAVSSSSGTLALDRLYPLDPALPMSGETRLLTEHFAAAGRGQQDGAEHSMALTMELEQRNELHLAPHAPAVR